MSNSARVKILYLEADNADAESVGALVNIVREVQGGRVSTRVEELAAPLQLEAPSDEEPAALPAPRASQPRTPKPAASQGGKRQRVNGAGDQLIALVRKAGGRPDWAKVADAIYGDATKTTKVRQLARQLVGAGKLRDGDGGKLEVA